MFSIAILLVALHESQPRRPNTPDPLSARKAGWQNLLDGATFKFPESRSGLWYSLTQYPAEGQVHIIYDRREPWPMIFKFVRDGKDVVTVKGHAQSQFHSEGNVLYFADFFPSSTGCSVAAYDLANGKQLWETKLSAMGNPGHSAYRNQVVLGVGKLGPVDSPAIKLDCLGSV